MGRKKFRGEDLCDPLVVGAEWKGRLQQIVCFRAGNEIIGFGEEREVVICL